MQSHRELIVEPVGIEVDSLPRLVLWPDLFGNDHPVEVEIGMGKGTFITEQAKLRPEVNFFGIEWARWFWRYSSVRLRRSGCAANARTVRADAGLVMREIVPDASVSVLHIYFPDPWPKRHHQSRRLVQDGFMEALHGILIMGGELRVKTDDEPYFQWMEKVFTKAKGYERLLWPDDPDYPHTDFERRFLAQGLPIYRARLRKIAR